MRTSYAILLLAATVWGRHVNAQWTQVGSTANNIIACMLPFENKLYLGGNFTNINGSTSYFSATYNGSTFGNHTTLLAGIGFQAFAVHNGSLFGGGGLTQQFGPIGVGVWNSGTWSGGYNIGNPVNVNALASFNGNLIVGGSFLDPALRVAQHNGTSYAVMGGGFDGTVTDFAIYNNELYACGYMENSGSTPLGNIAKWTGTAWVNVGTGLNGSASDMEVYNGQLYVCGTFSSAGGVAAQKIARWNGSAWSAVGSGIASGTGVTVNCMLATSAGLLVGGRFTNAGGVSTGNVALWNGTNWSAAGSFTDETSVSTMQSFNGYVYLSTYGIINSVATARLYRNGAVGVEEEAFAPDVTAFPNPCEDLLRLEGDLTMVKSMTVLDMMGRAVAVQRAANSVDLSALSPGLYHLVLMGDSGQRALQVMRH
jgi:hypothetical protein